MNSYLQNQCNYMEYLEEIWNNEFINIFYTFKYLIYIGIYTVYIYLHTHTYI